MKQTREPWIEIVRLSFHYSVQNTCPHQRMLRKFHTQRSGNGFPLNIWPLKKSTQNRLKTQNYEITWKTRCNTSGCWHKQLFAKASKAQETRKSGKMRFQETESFSWKTLKEMRKQSSGWGRLFSHYLSEIRTLTKTIKRMEKPWITSQTRFKNRQLTTTWHGGPHPVFGGLRQKNF